MLAASSRTAEMQDEAQHVPRGLRNQDSDKQLEELDEPQVDDSDDPDLFSIVTPAASFFSPGGS